MRDRRATHVRELVTSVVRRHPWSVGVSLALMVLVSVVEGAIVGLLAPLLALVGLDAGDGASGPRNLWLIDAFRAIGLPPTLEVVLVLAVVGVVVEHALRFAERRYTRGFVGRLLVDLRLALYDAYLRSSWPYWTQKSVGHAAGVLTLECYRALSALCELMVFLSEMTLVLALLGLAFVLSWQVAAIFVTAGIVVGLVLRRGVLTGYHEGTAITAWNSALQRTVHETLGAAKLIKASANEAASLARLGEIARALNEVEVRGAVTPFRATAVFAPLVISLLSIGLYVALTVFRVHPAGVIVLMLALYRASARVIVAQRSWHMLVLNAPAYVALQSELGEARAAAEAEPIRADAAPCPSLERAIALRRVSYSHRPDVPLLREVDLEIPSRRTIALVGGSGAGKTTVLDLVLGLLEPQSGAVLIDGVDLRRVERRAWRAQISYVGQDVVLFDDTIAGNIRWAKPDATDEELAEATRLAHAADFIAAIPEGLAARVGDRGVRLSGGERQRIALARALVRRPALLILDEATSNLDAEAEGVIQAAIEELRSRMTILVVAHRLATVRNADWIYVLEEGGVVQQGRWDQLVAMDGRFRTLWALQSRLTPAAAAP